MSTAEITASPRAPRARPQHPQSPAQAPQSNAGRQSQRKPRGNRAHNGHNHHNGVGASPIKIPSGADPAAESVTYAAEDAPLPVGLGYTKKHTQSQPSIDRVFSPNGAHGALTDSDSVPTRASATPAKIQGAYAGPTFHASPAPSALPIPKFLSRSVPAKTRTGPPTPPPEDSSDSANSPSPSASPSRAPMPMPPRNEFSPLDMLFKADQAERARNVHPSPSSNTFFHQPNQGRPQHFKHDSYNSSHGVFPIELDGESNNAPVSRSPVPSPAGHRSVTDPHKVMQLKDLPQQSHGNDVMQDLMSRLSMSQKKPHSATPPRPDSQDPSKAQSRHETPSPFHDGRPIVRSTSGPTTPQQATPESSDFFYGNRNLSPLFKAAKGDTPKRNSGLRTEVTADSPMLIQSAFQDFSSVQPQRMMDPDAFSRVPSGNGNQGPSSARRGSAPFIQPHQQSPGRGRRTPGRQSHQPRQDFQTTRGNFHGPNHRGGKAAGPTSPASTPKSTTTMMSFVPASVAAKAKPKQQSSTPPFTSIDPATTTNSSNTLALEQDLKRLLNLGTPDISGVR